MKMAESSTNSSQESLPLSQETFQCLLQMMSQPGFTQETNYTLPDVSLDTPSPLMPPPSPLAPCQTSLPATTDWAGPYEFQVHFNHQDNNSKNINWIFTEKNKSLYIKKKEACPINFSANVFLDDVFVRAMVVFTSPESASEVVTRCVNHSIKELDEGTWEAEHFIRCESHLASYKVDPNSKRHSVIVPFENPPIGQNFSTYIYKFLCWTSCSGGPNRRPLSLVFTLENNLIVLGRCVINLKVCASPRRDSKEKGLDPVGNTSKKHKMPDQFSLSKMLVPSVMPLPKKPKTDNQKAYCIKVKDVKCYRFLKQMKWTFEMNKAMSMLPPGFRAYFQVVRSSDEEEKSYSS